MTVKAKQNPGWSMTEKPGLKSQHAFFFMPMVLFRTLHKDFRHVEKSVYVFGIDFSQFRLDI